ncbi:hypothetical protein ACU4GD_32310 [Cupriavidus basilensis]
MRAPNRELNQPKFRKRRRPQREAKAIIAERFKAADGDHDGKLSREEAKAGMPEVYKRFDQIDVRKQGYVTGRQIGAYWEAKTQGNRCSGKIPFGT